MTVVAIVVRIGRIEIHEHAFPIIALDALLPVQMLDDDRLEALVNGIDFLPEVLDSADKPVSMAPIFDARLDSR
jgi:hypothetical protein